MDYPALLKGAQRSVKRYPVHLFPKHLFQLRLRCGHFPRRQYRKNAYPRAGLFKMVLIKQIIDFISRFHLAKVVFMDLIFMAKEFRSWSLHPNRGRYLQKSRSPLQSGNSLGIHTSRSCGRSL